MGAVVAPRSDSYYEIGIVIYLHQLIDERRVPVVWLANLCYYIL
jgi:hypothetical protein